MGELDSPGTPAVTQREAVLEDLVAQHTALGDVHAAMNADMPVTGRQTESCQTALTLAFPFLSYIRAVSRYCREHDIRKVYFLSREGRFFKRLFDAMERSEMETHYLCVSRIALLMLTMEDLNERAVDHVLDLFEHHSHLKVVSIKQLLYILKLDHPEAFRIVRHFGHDARRPMPFKENRERFKAVLLDERMRCLFARLREDYLALFLRYLRQVKLPDADRILLCDMGWSGSMQTYLAGLLSKQGSAVRVHGFYFGYDQTIDAQKHAASPDNVVKTGYFVYDGDPARLREQQIINNLSLEILASTGHGSVVSYRDQQGIVTPVFRHVPEEVWQYRRFIRPFQNLIIGYAERYGALVEEIHRVYPESEVYAYNMTITHRLFYQPSQEFQRFLAFVFYDDFFGKDVRILLAPYTVPNWRARIRFGLRGILSRLALYLTPSFLLGWLTEDEVEMGCRCGDRPRQEAEMSAS